MAQVIQPLELALLEVDLFQGSTTLFLQHAEALYGRMIPLQQKAHVGLHFLHGKSNLVEGHDGAQPLQVAIVILPIAHHLFHRAAQTPTLVFPQNVHGDMIALARLLYGHIKASK